MTGTLPWIAQDGVEPIQSDTIGAIANRALYNTVSGCTAAYSGVNMQVTIAAGVITHNGTNTIVAGNTVTLISDPSLPRWAYIYVNSSGVAVVIHGAAAAAPAVPDTGANPTNQLVYVQAALTTATNATYKLDKRILADTAPAHPEAWLPLAMGFTTAVQQSALVANQAYLIPMNPLLRPTTITKLVAYLAGSTDNIDVGIYSTTDYATFTRVVSLGSTAFPGTNSRFFDIADTPLAIGTVYYLAIAVDGTTLTLLANASPAQTVLGLGGGSTADVAVLTKTTSFPLPTSIASPVHAGGVNPLLAGVISGSQPFSA